MKIYRRELDGYYYFMTTKENGLFCFSLELPDRDTLQLCPCCIGVNDEEKAWNDGVVVSDDIYRKFNSIYDKKRNYKDVCSLLMEVFKDADRESLDRSFRRDDKIFDLTDRCIKEYIQERRILIKENKKILKEYRDYQKFLFNHPEEREHF